MLTNSPTDTSAPRPDATAAGPPDDCLDTIGVGFGPANIAIAVAYAESGNTSRIRFLEASAGPNWQPGMLIDGSDIQHHPLRDFITPRNPCSRFGYLSYLKSEGRLFQFLNLDAPFPPRSDYARYVCWVANQFRDRVLYSERVARISLTLRGGAAGRLVRVESASGRSFTARSLCFAPGRSRNIPPVFGPFLGADVVHFTDYSSAIDRWRGAVRSVAVIGSSQSAVEILLDAHARLPGVTLHSVFRKFAYVLKDTSPFTEDLILPEFTDYFYESPPESKRELTRQLLRSNYGSVDHDVLRKLYFTLYEHRVNGVRPIAVHNNTEVAAVSREAGGIRLSLRDVHCEREDVLRVDAVILATGFKNAGRDEHEELVHPLLRDVAPFYAKNDDGTLHVTRDYRLAPLTEDAPPIVINGLCEPSHGLGDAGSFSLLSYRASEIERSLKAQLERVAR